MGQRQRTHARPTAQPAFDLRCTGRPEPKFHRFPQHAMRLRLGLALTGDSQLGAPRYVPSAILLDHRRKLRQVDHMPVTLDRVHFHGGNLRPEPLSASPGFRSGRRKAVGLLSRHTKQSPTRRDSTSHGCDGDPAPLAGDGRFAARSTAKLLAPISKNQWLPLSAPSAVSARPRAREGPHVPPSPARSVVDRDEQRQAGQNENSGDHGSVGCQGRVLHPSAAERLDQPDAVHQPLRRQPHG